MGKLSLPIDYVFSTGVYKIVTVKYVDIRQTYRDHYRVRIKEPFGRIILNPTRLQVSYKKFRNKVFAFPTGLVFRKSPGSENRKKPGSSI